MFRCIKLFKNSSSKSLQLASYSTESMTGVEDSIIHRVKILNLPTHEMGSIKKLFQGLDLNKYKKAPKWDYAYMHFENEEAARNAMATLNNVTFKKRALSTEYSKVSEKAFRSRFETKKKELEPKELDTRTPAEMLADQVTPLYKIPYEKQIEKKHKLGARFLNTLRKKVNALPALNENTAQIAWTNTLEDMDCEIQDIIQSPNTHGYRTKCEFSIGKNLEGEKTVGFLLGSYRDGCTFVLNANDSLHVSDKAKEIALAMEKYVRESEHDVYDRVEKVGVWRTIMTKTQRTGDNMVVIQISAKELTQDQLDQEKKRLVAYWSGLKDRINTTTLLLQIWNGDSNGITDKGTTEVLTGDGYVYEELLGCKFRISSSAFFQVNTPATELLYSKCAEWCNIDANKKTTLLDLCCGTGTIGITMANSVDRVIGVEMVPEAIVDAKANASINNITNVEYHASKVEEKIDIVINEKNEQVVAILDPPRSGVHSSVIRAVRESQQIEKVIFISCDAKQAMQNFIGLCRPTSNRFKGLPFKPSRAVSIDLFPHTDHCELMIEFVRIQK